MAPQTACRVNRGGGDIQVFHFAAELDAFEANRGGDAFDGEEETSFFLSGFVSTTFLRQGP